MLPLLLALAPQTTGGFEAGQLITLDDQAGPTGSKGAFQLVDPVSGSVETLDYGQVFLSTGYDTFAYDPFRDRLIFGARFVSGGPFELHAGTADGAFSTLLPLAVEGLAPAGDGRIFYRYEDTGTTLNRVRWIDAAGLPQVAGDGAGGLFADPEHLSPVSQEFDPGTNSLITARTLSGTAVGSCGGVTGKIRVARYDFSPDGQDILSSDCTYVSVGTDFAGNPDGGLVGLSRIDDGRLLLTAFGDSATGPDLGLECFLIEPTGGPGGSLSVTDYAVLDGTPLGVSFSSFIGATYSSLRDEVVLANRFTDALYTAGEGDLVATSITPMGSGLSIEGQYDGLVEVRTAGVPAMFPDITEVDIAVGGTQQLEIDFGPDNAGSIHAVVGSTTGFAPATDFAGVQIPLVLDAYTSFSLISQNAPPYGNSFGLLDAQGRASASYSLPPGLPTSLVGVKVRHAAIVIDPQTASLRESSNAVPFEIVF